jgi:Protein of unknown function (DUF3102)
MATEITPEEFAAGARQSLHGGKAAETSDQVLARLATEIRASVTTSTAAAIEAGHKLIEAKTLLPHGEWLPWLRDRVEMSERVAQYHMQLALMPNPKRVSDLPVRVALKALRAEKKAKAAAGPNDWPANPQGRRSPVSIAGRPRTVQQHERAHLVGGVLLESGHWLPPRLPILLCA